jgi:hypothetical protein
VERPRIPGPSGTGALVRASGPRQTRRMSTQPRPMLRGAVRTVLVLVILGACPGCDGTGPASRSNGEQERNADRSRGTEVEARDPGRTGPQPCPSQPSSAWTTQDDMTRDLPAYGKIGDLVVDRQGTATLAWTDELGGHWNVRTSDQPSSPGDPQVLPGPAHDPVPDGAEVSAHFPLGDHLGVDGSGALTAMWLQDLRLPGGYNTEYYDIVLSDRAAGGAWSPVPAVVGDGGVYESGLAVNASGAAVVGWDQYDDGEFPAYVSYRAAAGAPWTPAEKVAPDAQSLQDVGIDDAGRVVLLYDTSQGEGVMAVRGTPITGWSRPHPLTAYGATLSVSAGGAAVVAFSRGARGRNYTIRMSPSGTWDPPVRQPGAVDYPYRTVAMDGAGRALYVWWDEQRVMTRWSSPGGRWRAPCVLAEGVPDPRYFDDVDSHVAVNPHGDALVVWRTKDETPHLWARYKPAGQAWTEAIEVTANVGVRSHMSDGVRPDVSVSAW